ncbi:hypothetical protein E2C01_087651 [Portunus trituberculatus]|uniref:Uncharacterized protein n=1 Tax=Portunus trituberculatus TaxID=210409 RepID=A0A5B7JEM7_PORTR|nr:hypothetical protein [Portunus trituberculatus]
MNYPMLLHPPHLPYVLPRPPHDTSQTHPTPIPAPPTRLWFILLKPSGVASGSVACRGYRSCCSE